MINVKNNKALECLDYYVDIARKNEQTFKLTKKRIFNTGDKYTDNVNLYHNLDRRYEGFIFLLEDYLLGGKSLTINEHNIKANSNWSVEEYMWLIYAHRIFGSGTSNVSNHGYHNSCLTKLNNLENFNQFNEYVLNYDGNFVSCAVNQPPRYPLKKLVREHFKGWFNYLLDNLKDNCSPLDIVNVSNDYNLKNNLHRFNFHYLLMSGDVANYTNMETPLKNLFSVKEDGDCALGPTSISSMKIIFGSKYKYNDFINLCIRYNIKPIDLEDLLCVWFKYIKNPIWSFYVKDYHQMSDFENGWDIVDKHKSYYKFKEYFNNKNLFT